MVYKMKLRVEVLIWDNVEKRHVYKQTFIGFTFKDASDMIVLLKNMATYADEPLDFTITKENKEEDIDG